MKKRKPATPNQKLALSKGRAKRSYLCAKAQLGMLLNRPELIVGLTEYALFAVNQAYNTLDLVREEEII